MNKFLKKTEKQVKYYVWKYNNWNKESKHWDKENGYSRGID